MTVGSDQLSSSGVLRRTPQTPRAPRRSESAAPRRSYPITGSFLASKVVR
jgi:hypothetical protein